ncbi:hypothetical protein EV102420_04_00110 [Pseudescherichia vulneris NBRC 102420]|uniref:Uncharacterized protein n=1 Tax=Pseudescherichia vulneris NBRC 102420 TaxID=1115515 RepID=A0A090UYW4_PSEVU|nr:hypothetical protein EV102420_04_00110 [Pseudescherichia vulneris NBRC 102420]STQ61811.1 Uncharacterised protein [Pseudescherichia vulneris]
MRAEVATESVFLNITSITDQYIEGIMVSDAGLSAVCAGAARNDRVNIIEPGQANSYLVMLPAKFIGAERSVRLRRC